MKKQTVFITLSGNIGDYVVRITRESKTKDLEVQALQTRLNTLIKQQSILPATAENLSNLWKNMTELVKDVELVLDNKKDQAFLDIVKKVNNIGYSIAYICKRRNGGWTENEVRFKNTMTDEEILHTFKVILLNCYNNGTFKKGEDGKWYVAFKKEQDGNWYVENTLLKHDYQTMTDEELLPIAKECVLDQIQRDQRVKEDEIKRIHNTFKRFGIEIDESTYRSIESDAANATLQECYAVMNEAVRQVGYCKDRIKVLESGNEVEIAKLHDWDEREPKSHYVSDNKNEILEAMAQCAISKVLYFQRAKEIIDGETEKNVGFSAKLAFEE